MAPRSFAEQLARRNERRGSTFLISGERRSSAVCLGADEKRGCSQRRSSNQRLEDEISSIVPSEATGLNGPRYLQPRPSAGAQWRKVSIMKSWVGMGRASRSNRLSQLPDFDTGLEAAGGHQSLNPGSLFNYISTEQLKKSCCDPTPESVVPLDLSSPSSPSSPSPRALRLGGVVSPAYSVASSRMVGGAGPRRRVHVIGRKLTEHQSASRCPSLPARVTVTPCPLPPIVRAAHPLPFGSPLAAAHIRESSAAAIQDSDPCPESPAPSGDWLASPHGQQKTINHGQGVIFATPDYLPNASYFSGAILASLGNSALPDDHRHPMLSCLVEMEQEDVKGKDDEHDAGPTDHRVNLVDRTVTHISRRFERHRWKESRCVKNWSIAPVATPEFQCQREKDPDAHLRNYLPAIEKQQPKKDAHPEWAQVAADFKQIAWLMDPAKGSSIPPDAFTPLMFWLGFARHRRSPLAVFEVAFGRGDIAADKLAELAPYFDLQIQLVEGFRTLARRECFEQMCEYVTDAQRLKGWWSSMSPDCNGCVGLDQIEIMLARLPVTTTRNQRVLKRFLAHAAARYQHSPSNVSHAAAGGIDSTSIVAKGSSSLRQQDHHCDTDRSKFGFQFFQGLLCRAVVTCCIVKVLDLVDPWSRARLPGGYNVASPANVARADANGGANGTHSENAETGGVDFKVSQRWAQMHRRISVSLMVNHRYWGREGKMVLASLKQPPLEICEDFTPQQWQTLFQRARAQGMASTFPVGDEVDDPNFLSKKAKCAADVDV